MYKKILVWFVLVVVVFLSGRYIYNLSQKAEAAYTPWSGIIDSSRAIDWSQAGIPGGIPNRTTICANVLTTDTTDQIQSKITNCPQDQVVQFPSGTWTLSHSLTSNKGVVLRGNGPTNTKLIMSGGNGNIFMGPSDVGVGGQGSYPSGPYGSINWIGGLTKGSNTLTLTSTSGLVVGQTVLLDQSNNTNIVFPVGTEGTQYGGANNPPNAGFDQVPGTRLQFQIVGIASCDGNSTEGHACSGTQITIDSPVDYTHDSNLSPRVMYWSKISSYLHGGGVENMKVDAQKHDRAIAFTWCTDCWVKNVEIDNVARGAVMAMFSNHVEIRDNYISTPGALAGPTQYGFEIIESTLVKLENNIIFNITAPVMPMTDDGLVVGYNYAQHIYGPDNQFAAFEPHQSHSYNHLYEGNVMYMMSIDNVWGSSSQLTIFRNRDSGLAPNKTNYRVPVFVGAHQRYLNFIGNVLGTTGFHNKYEENYSTRVTTSDPDTFIYGIGFWSNWTWPDPDPNCASHGIAVSADNCVHDDITNSSMMRWGNWDAATNSTRWLASEVPTTDPTFPNSVPANQTLPASFYLDGKPSWFGSVPWPAIGPDVTCSANCITNAGNHANKIPAQLCYENGAKDSNGYLTAFDASNCYGSSVIVPPPSDTTTPSVPAGLSATATSSSQINLAWTASTDNVGVTGYKIYRAGTQIGTSATNSYSDTGLSALTSYTYTVSAYDAAGNVSAQSASVSATTSSATTPPLSTTWSHVQTNAANTSSSTNMLPFTSANTAGNLIVVEVDFSNNVNFTSLTDALGNTYTQIGTEQNSSAVGVKSRLYYAKNIKAGANSVITTLSGAPSYHELYIHEYSGLDTTSPLDGYSVAMASGTTFTSNNVSVTSANDLLYGLEIDSQYGKAVSGWSTRSTLDGDVAADMNAPTSGAYAFTGNSSGAFVAWVAAFKLNGSSTPPANSTGMITPTSATCTIASGGSSCNVTLTWTTTNPVATSSVTASGMTTINGNSGSQAFPVPYGGRTFYLYNSAALLAQSSATANCISGTNWNGSTCATIVVVDTQAPTVPAGLSATATSSSQINLAWTASTDNVGVTGYNIYRNGTKLNTATGTTYSNTGLSASTAYSYTVSAYDTAGNTSAQSASASATTQTVVVPTAKFSMGDNVKTTSKLNVRNTPSTKGSRVGTQPLGALGMITGGPTVANGYTWWNVNFNTGADGWVAETYLVKNVAAIKKTEPTNLATIPKPNNQPVANKTNKKGFLANVLDAFLNLFR